MDEPTPTTPSLPAYPHGAPTIPMAQQKPLIRSMNRMLKAKLPKLFRAGKGIESSSNIKIGHKKKKDQPTTKFW